MGSSLEEWRRRIGGFHGSSRSRTLGARQSSQTGDDCNGLLLAVATVLFALLVVSGVEPNPGPTSTPTSPDAASQDFDETVAIPMGTFLRFVPRDHLQERGIHIVTPDHAPAASKFSLGEEWNNVVKMAFKEQHPKFPCSSTIKLKGGHVKQAYTKKQSNSKFWTSTGYCKRKDGPCLKFKLTVKDFDHEKDNVMVQVESIPTTHLLQGEASDRWHEVECQSKKCAKTWDPAEWEKMKPSLLLEAPSVVYNRYFARYAQDRDNVPLPGPIQAIYDYRSKMTHADDLDSDENLDFIKQKAIQEKHELFDYDRPNLVQYAWITDAQRTLLTEQAKGGTAYLDSTGGFLRNAPPAREGELPRAMFYAALTVKPSEGKHSVPVSQMITTSQSALSCGFWLQSLKLHWNQKWSGAGRFFRTVVIDDSWAYIHSVLQSFNNEDVTNFLGRCFKEEHRGNDGEDRDFRSRTMLHICAFHALRRVRTYVSRRTTKTEVRKLAVNAYRALLRTDSLAQAETVVRLMATVFGQKKKSAAVESAKNELERIQEDYAQRLERLKNDKQLAAANRRATQEGDDPPSDERQDTQEDRPDADEMVAGAGQPLYKCSPYYNHLHAIIEAAQAGPDRGTGNPFYIDKFLAYLEREHVAYLPMLNRTFVKKEVNPVTHLLTNNYVEKWFGTVKTELFKKVSNVRRGEVLRKLSEHTDGQIERNKFEAPRVPRYNSRMPNQVQRKNKKQPAAQSGSGSRKRTERGRPTLEDEQLLPAIDNTSEQVDQWGGVAQHSIVPAPVELVQSASTTSRHAPVPQKHTWTIEIRPDADDNENEEHVLVNSDLDDDENEEIMLEYEEQDLQEFGEPVASVQEQKSREQVELELNTPNPDMILSSEEEVQYRKLATTLLDYIKSDHGTNYMRKVICKEVKSRRRKEWEEKKIPILGMEALGPFTAFDDLTQNLLSFITDFIERNGFEDLGYGDYIFTHGVLIPELVIQGFGWIEASAGRECTLKKAEMLFEHCSKKMYCNSGSH